jgi:cell division protein FtsI (penicillin-binding protein 3)
LHERAETLAFDRLRTLARIGFLWGIAILARLIHLQVIDHEKYANLAHLQQEDDVELRAPRGTIYDRYGQPLAMSVPVESVCVNPMRIKDAAIAAELLAKVLDLDARPLAGRIKAAAEARRGFLWVKRKITNEEGRKLRSFGVDWIEFRSESTRFYPKEDLAAHVLGGVNHEERGNAGIEQALNKDLEGKAGVMRIKADVLRNVFEQEIFTDAIPGKNITLTIDERIQNVAEKELAKAVVEHGASTGSLVAMDPRSGDILAIANYPTYNPNVPPKHGEKVDNRRNLAVIAPFEPGSVFKVITLATALETTRLTPQSTFHCGNGAMTLFRRVIHDAKPHGVLTVADILAKSSNIGAIKVGLEVGNHRLYEYIRRFGFGERTGLPLPGESAGLVRKPERWIPSSIGSVAMGHEISTTTVQLARACSVMANGGYLVRPRLVIAKERPGAPPEIEPRSQPVRVLRPENAIKMRLMMERVIVQGTGRRATLDGYTAGGKTGSAQIYDYDARVYTHRYNGSFMGFAPVNNPAIVVVVTLNGTRTGNQGFGGVVAAPVFREVAGAALRLLDVQRDVVEPPEDMDGDAPDSDLAVAGLGEPPEQEELALAFPPSVQGPDPPPHMVPDGPKAPDFQGKTKRAVLEESASLGVRVEIAGTGIARWQDPRPGAPLRPGYRVRVQFAP